MNNILVALSTMFIIATSNAQIPLILNQQSKTNIQALNIGDKVPDISLGTIMNNHTGKTRFSDFKGKLLILIFWDTYCASCIESFPKEEFLQQELGDSAQLMLVNSQESAQQIAARLKQYHIKMPNLPSIVSDTILKHLFPSKYVGSTAWIDADGIVRVIDGIAQLTNTKEKIRKAIAGNTINYIRNEITAYDSISLKEMELNSPSFSPLISGAIYPFQPSYGATGGYARVTDSITQTTRYTFVNSSVLQLYMSAYKEVFDKYLIKRIYGPRNWEYKYEAISLEVKDTLRYTADLNSLANDDDYKKSSYCYEQIVPKNMPENERRQLIKHDLNSYFGNRYNTDCKIEKRTIPCYLLVRTSKIDKIKTTSMEFGTQEFTSQSGKLMKKYTSWSLNRLISYNIQDLQEINQRRPYIFDYTGYKDKVDIILPNMTAVSTLKDLRKALKQYDLDIINGQMEVEMLIIREYPLTYSR